MTFQRFLALALGAVLLASCASMTEDECAFADWEAKGLSDGISGFGPTGYERFIRACSRYDIVPDIAAYERGREEGLETYCTPGGVYSAGMRGLGNVAQCGYVPELTRIHQITTSYNQASRDVSRTRNEYENIFRYRANTVSDIRELRRRLRRDDLEEKKRKELRDRLRWAEDRLDDYDLDEVRLQFELRDAERALARAEAALWILEEELGFAPARRRGGYY